MTNLKKLLKDYKKIFYYSSLAALLFMHAVTLFLIHKRMPCLIDSDMSSELKLGKLLCEEHSLLSRNWFYSTELRVLNTQILYSFFFYFTNSWHLVRLLSQFVMHGIMSAVTVFFCRKAGCGRYAFMTALCVMTSLSYSYFMILVMGCYYIPHFSISFLVLAFTFMYSSAGGKKKKILLLCTLLISFAAGLGGIRQIFITFLPLVMAVSVLCIDTLYKEGFQSLKKTEYFKSVMPALAGMTGGGFGFIINNRILPRYYHFHVFYSLNFISPNYDQLKRVLDDILVTLGYSDGPLDLKNLISNVSCFIIIIMGAWSVLTSIKKDASSKRKLMSLFFLFNLLLYILLYTFTDMEYSSRYSYPVLMLLFPLTAMSLHEEKTGGFPVYFRCVLSLIFAGSVAARGCILYSSFLTYDKTRELKDIAVFLEEKDYDIGFATFWNANVVEELTNGKIDMYSWQDNGAVATGDIEDFYGWLQPVCHLEDKPFGKPVAIYQKTELKTCIWKQSFSEEKKIFETSEYVVYGYNDYDDMVSGCSDYKYSADETRWLKNGENIDGKRVLHEEGVSFGPYITLKKGKYDVTVKGENLNNIKFKVYNAAEQHDFELKDCVARDDMITFSIYPDAVYHRSELLLENEDDEDVVISDIVIDWNDDYCVNNTAS